MVYRVLKINAAQEMENFDLQLPCWLQLTLPGWCLVSPPTKESRDPALALADGMKFLLRFGDDRSAVSAPAALAADG